MKLRLNAIKFILVFVLSTWATNGVYGQLSKVHYIPPITTSDGSDAYPFEQWIHISTPSIDGIGVAIKPIGDDSNINYLTVSNQSPITFGDTYPQNYDVTNNTQLVIKKELGSTVFSNKGYIIEAEKPVYVSVRFLSQYQAGAIVSKGNAGLGTEFLLGGFTNEGGSGVNAYVNFFSILATEDNTEVEVSFPKNVRLTNYSGGYPVSIKLEKNESYVGVIEPLYGADNLDGMIGGKIVSDKFISVISGSATGTNGLGGGRDFGIDQLVDVSNAGKEFIFVRGASLPGFGSSNQIENIILTPLLSNTSYSINGIDQGVISGAYVAIEGDKYSAQNNMYVETDAPVMAFQGVSGVDGGSSANQGMFVVPPLNCGAKGNINNIPFINYIGANQQEGGGINIVSEKNKEVLLNGTTISGGQNVPANANYVTYRLNNLSSELYKIESTGELYVSYYTFSGAATSGAFYSGFQSPPEFTFELDLISLGTCLQNNLTLNTTNTENLDSYSWWYNSSLESDEAQWEEISTNSNNESFTPTEPGWYQLRGSFSCGNDTEELRSQTVFVGNCPADNDNDGVIDNLDLDEDNDGILDSVESGGSIILDFSDHINPKLPSTTKKNISVSPTYTITASEIIDNGSITGDNQGNITSIVNASAEAYNNYSLNFNTPTTVRIVFPETPNYIENEIISFSTSDDDKTISLINADSEVLVDTNYDEAFESGIHYYTNKQVSLKYDPNKGSLNNVELIANSITNLKISHLLKNVYQDATLKYQLQIIDYPLDSDADSFPDHLELDSDDDGCNDVIEAGYEDPDSDGVLGNGPVLYDPRSSSSTADNRGRVIFPGHDYSTPPSDNDNNSIFDFQEAGTAATLSKNFATTSAVRCEGESLTLTLETPDSDSVLWEVDTDADGIFEPAAPLGTTSDNNGGVYEFKIDAVTIALDQAVFRAQLSKKTYACTTDTDLFTLTVNDNTTKPNLEPLTIVCYGATVGDLNVANVVWYAAATGGSPLADNVVLAHNTPYFAASVVNGCVGELRSETKVVVNDPDIGTISGNTTFCAQESITLSLDTNKILPSPDDFARINNLVYIKNANGPVQYDNGYYYTQQGIKSGVQPITWPEAKALGESIVGATMYIINDAIEEEAVYQGLQQMGLTGGDSVAFWLGLFQDQNASDYSEPDGGWYWVDGTPLDYKNWWNGEPNDYPSNSNNGEEDYGQFEFGNNGKFWNDMSLTEADGQSYPIFEYKAQTQIEWFTVKNGVSTPVPGATNSSQLEVSLAETTDFFVRVTTNGVECNSEIFTITINPLPIANTLSDPIEICVDNNNGAITSVDLKGNFDLTFAEATILGSQRDINHTVAYYTTRGGAENEVLAAKILTPDAYINTSNPQTIYYRVTNTDTNCVSDVAELTINANPLPPSITIPDVVICDDLVSGSDLDGILRFDLSLQNSTIETLLGSTTQYTISYHETLADAEANANAITEYTTVASDNSIKNIVVRLEDNATGCVRTDNNLNLVVAELPTINQNTFEREQCDTDSDGIVQDNLTLYNPIFSLNHENETFTYYTDATHSNQITNPVEFYNSTMNQTIYVKIANANGCERTTDPATSYPLTIEIRVRASTIKNTFLETYYTCLDPSDKTNTGISTFDKSVFADLESKLITEHPAFSDNNVTIQFYENESDAASKVNAIDTSQDYVNTTPDRQEIWAAVDANGFTETTCLGLKQVAHFIVEPLAVLHPVTIPRQCDGDSPLDLDSQDGRFPFDTSTVMAQLLLTQNPNDYQITFYDQNDTVISTNGFPAVYDSPSQTIRVVVENNPSKVAPACYQEASIEFTVDDSPEIGSYTLPIVCDNDDGAVDGLGVFDTSALNTELLSGQTNMEIRFLQRDGTGNETILGTRLPNPFTTQTTTVIAQIFNPNNTVCVAEKNITFQVNENPVFDLPTNLVFCQNLGFDTIYVTSPRDVYTYSWARNGVTIPDQTAQDLIITQGGTYTVTATNPVTGCTTTKAIGVYESEIALFDAEDITVFDLTGDGTNRIEIDKNELGIGNYEFKLNNNPYQDSPLFENVPPGIHTLYVNDKNGCGEVALDISVIGYSFYFTPNGDGKNDTWQILGVNATFQSSSLIYIFDRHGRLMAQIPADGIGWNGTYNGTIMPADDYWFRVKLEDGRSFTGHFSLIR